MESDEQQDFKDRSYMRGFKPLRRISNNLTSIKEGETVFVVGYGNRKVHRAGNNVLVLSIVDP